MATTVWVPFGSGGVMAAPQLSKEMLELAQYELQFDPFCDLADDYGPGKGDIYYWGVDQDLSGAPTTFAGATLNETSLIPKYKWTQIRDSVTVVEVGSGASLTNFAQTLSAINLDKRTRRRLKNQMVRVFDNGAATAFKATDIKYSPTGAAAGTFSTTGTAGAAVTNNLTSYHFRESADYRYTTLRAEPWDDEGNYICITTRKGVRALYDDPDWQEAKKYADAKGLMKGEMGQYYKFRILETNDTNALSTKGSGGPCAEAVFFGAEAVTKAVAQAPIITAEEKDHGRFVEIAWRSILAYGLTYDYTTVGKATVIHIDST